MTKAQKARLEYFGAIADLCRAKGVRKLGDGELLLELDALPPAASAAAQANRRPVVPKKLRDDGLTEEQAAEAYGLDPKEE